MDLFNKRVCIIGGAGFLGRNIDEYFQGQGLDVFIVRKSEFNLSESREAERLIKLCRPALLIHAAADIGGIDYNRLYPADVFHNNLLMAINILDACSRNHIEKVILIGSACAYPGYTDDNLVENEFLDGRMHESVEVYGFSKRALYLGAKAYRKQYGLNAVYVNLSHIYGPYDKYDEVESHVLAALIRKFVMADKFGYDRVICWGTGKAIREFLYAGDCAEAIYLTAKKYDDELPMNIGTGLGTTIKELAELIKELTGFKGEIIWDTTKQDGAMKKVLNVEKMKTVLNWSPKLPLRDGIKIAIADFKNRYIDGGKQE